jgi:hypothetical protein
MPEAIELKLELNIISLKSINFTSEEENREKGEFFKKDMVEEDVRE